MNELSKILIVDDSKTNRQILELMLEDYYSVKTANSGEEALKEVLEFIPDLILLDIMMPGISGFEVLKILKSNSETKGIPVLFISGNISTEFKVQAFELGGADYIIKPFEEEEVLARIETHLNLKIAREKIEEYNKELEKKLEDRTKELVAREKDSAFSLLIQGIIHNLRGPLSTVSGNTDMIKMIIERELKKDELNIEDLVIVLKKILVFGERLKKSGYKLADMIDSLLIKSKADKSNKIEKTDVNSLLKSEIEFLNANTRFKHYTTKEYNFYDGELLTNIIPSEISQIISNLINNSLHAMWDKKDSKMFISTGKKDNFIWFSIRDNGSGIPQNIQDKIFDPFFSTKTKIEDSEKNSSSSKDKSEPTGTGLGLYSVKETVNSYDGKLVLNSEDGVGTEFIIYLPSV